MRKLLDPATAAAVRRVVAGEHVKDAARAEGVKPNTLYRALRKLQITYTHAMCDPAIQAKVMAGALAVRQRPEVRANMAEAQRRRWAKAVVLRAELPLLRANVDRARDILDEGFGIELAVDALVQEFRMERAA